jgi:hypothetical protein
MKALPQVLFWLGIISVPLAWLLWYFGPEIELVRPVIKSGLTRSSCRAVGNLGRYLASNSSGIELCR